MIIPSCNIIFIMIRCIYSLTSNKIYARQVSPHPLWLAGCEQGVGTDHASPKLQQTSLINDSGDTYVMTRMAIVSVILKTVNKKHCLSFNNKIMCRNNSV